MQADEQFSRDLDAVRARLESLVGQVGGLSPEGRESVRAAFVPLSGAVGALKNGLEAGHGGLDGGDRLPNPGRPCSGLEAIEALIEVSLHGMLTTDVEGMITSCNGVAAALLRISAEKLIGRTICGFFSPEDVDGPLQLFRSRIDRGEADSSAWEAEIFPADGRPLYCALSVVVERDTSDEPRCLRWLICDMTARKEGLSVLDQVRATAQNYLDVAAVMILALDRRGRVTMINQKGCEVLDCCIDVAVGSNWFDTFLPEKEREKVKVVFSELAAGKRSASESFENWVRTTQGKECLIAWHTLVISDDRGQFSGVLSSGVDITECNRAEEKFRDSEEEHRLLFNGSTDAVFVHRISADGLPGLVTNVNDAACRLLGYERGEMVGRPLYDFIASGQIRNDEAVARIVGRIVEGNQCVFNSVLVAKDEGRIPVEISGNYFDFEGRPMILSLARDISERRAAEEALRASQSLYSTTIETMTDPIHVVDADLQITLFNNAFREWCERLGISPAQRGQNLLDAFPFLPDKVRTEYEEVFRNGKLLTTRETISIAGEEVITETRKIPVVEDGKAARVITLVCDITEPTRRENALRESEERFRGVFESSSDCIMVFDREFNCLYANQAALDFVVHTRSLVGEEPKPEFLERGLAGLHVRDSLAHVPRFCELCLARLMQVFAGGNVLQTEDVVQMGEHTVFSESTASPLKDHTGAVFAVGVVHRDITQRKRSEQELERSRQLLRDLAARLAEAEEAERRRLAGELHDQIGQTVTAIGMNLNYLRSRLPEDTPPDVPQRLDAAITLVEDAAQRVRDVMAELRPPVLDDYGFTSALRWYAEQFQKRHGLCIDLETVELAPRLSLEVETALFRIVQEACNNAIKHAAPRTLSIALLEAGEEIVKVTVSDDGVGFEPGRVGNPGRHSGWGLIIMRERAAAVGGEFHLASNPGEGTIVTVTVTR